MTHLFYALLVIFILVEMFILCDSKRVFRGIERMRKIAKEKKRNGTKVTTDDYGGGITLYVGEQIIYLLYCLVGLMSSQYLLFALILVMGLIPKRWLWLLRVDSVITIGILLFIMLNKYHFHINLYHLIFS